MNMYLDQIYAMTRSFLMVVTHCIFNTIMHVKLRKEWARLFVQKGPIILTLRCSGM